MTAELDIALTNYGTESHTKVLEPYVREVTIQGQAFEGAISRLNAALAGTNGHLNVFAASQSALTAAISITRLLWPNPASKDRDGKPLTGRPERARQWSIQRGKSIRRALGKPNEQASPLGNRQVRNQFEHFDEYLDGFLLDVHEGTIPSITVDMNIAPPDWIQSEQNPGSILRHYDNKNHVLSVLGVSMPLQELADEVSRIVKLADKWLLENDPFAARLHTARSHVARSIESSARNQLPAAPSGRQAQPFSKITWKKPYEHSVRNDND